MRIKWPWRSIVKKKKVVMEENLGLLRVGGPHWLRI